MSANLVIAHMNEAIELLKGIKTEGLQAIVVEFATDSLKDARTTLAQALLVPENTRLADAEEVLVDDYDPADELSVEFWHMYGDADDTFGDDIDQAEFDRILSRMSTDDANFYNNAIKDMHDAEGRDAIFEIIIDKWGNNGTN